MPEPSRLFDRLGRLPPPQPVETPQPGGFFATIAGFSPDQLQMLEAGREDLEAVRRGERPPARDLPGRVVGAIGQAPVLKQLFDAVGWYFGRAQPALAELTTQGVRGLLDPALGANQAAERFKAAWQEGDSIWDKLNRGMQEVADYRRDREPLFAAEKLLGELLIDPTILLGWGIAGRLARVVGGGVRGRVAALATGQESVMVRGLMAIDRLDQKFIEVTNLPFRALAGLYRRWGQRAAKSADELTRDALIGTITAGLGSHMSKGTVGSLTDLLKASALRPEPNQADALLNRAREMIEWSDPRGANERFFADLELLPAGEAVEQFLEKLSNVQRQIRRLVLQAATGNEKAISRLGDKMPAELRALWTREGVMRMADELKARAQLWYDPDLSGARAGTLAKLIDQYPRSLLAFWNYGPFNVIEEFARQVLGGEVLAVTDSVGIQLMVQSSEAALLLIPEVGEVALGAQGQRQVREMLGRLIQEEAAGTAVQLAGKPLGPELLSGLTGNARIDAVTKWLGAWSRDWGNKLTADIRRAFFMNRTREGFLQEMARAGVRDDPALARLFESVSLAPRLASAKATNELLDLLVMTMDSPEGVQTVVSSFGNPQLRAADVTKAVRRMDMLPKDVQNDLIQAAKGGMRLDQVDSLLEDRAMQPLLERYKHYPEYVREALSHESARILGSLPAGAAETAAQAAAARQVAVGARTAAISAAEEAVTAAEREAAALAAERAGIVFPAVPRRGMKTPQTFDAAEQQIDDVDEVIDGLQTRLDDMDNPDTKAGLALQERIDRAESYKESLEAFMGTFDEGAEDTLATLRERLAAAQAQPMPADIPGLQRTGGVEPDSPAEAYKLFEAARATLETLQQLPETLRHVTAERAKRLAFGDPAVRQMWDEVNQELSGFLSDAVVNQTVADVLAKLEAWSPKFKVLLKGKSGRESHVSVIPISSLRALERRGKMLQEVWAGYLEDTQRHFATIGDLDLWPDRRAFWDAYRDLQRRHWDPFWAKVNSKPFATGTDAPLSAAAKAAWQARFGTELSQEVAERLRPQLFEEAGQLYATSHHAANLQLQVQELASQLKKVVRREPTRGAEAAAIQEWGGRMATAISQLPAESLAKLHQAKAKALLRATEAMKDEFTNYMDALVPDTFMRAFFPFWQYASRAFPFLARQAIQKPLLGKMFLPDGLYWRNTDDGYLRMDIGGFRINPTQGTILGRLRRAFRKPYAKEYEGLYGGFDQLITAGERFGFWMHPVLKMTAEAIGVLSEQGTIDPHRIPAVVTEELPPVLSLFTEAAVGVTQFAQELTAEEATMVELLSREPGQSEGFISWDTTRQLLGDRWREYFARMGTTELGKPWSATTAAEKAMLRRNAAFRRLISTMMGLGTYRPQEWHDFQEKIKTTSLELLRQSGEEWTEEQYELWRKAGYSASRMPIDPALKRQIYELEGFRILGELSEPLKSDQAQRVLEATRRIHLVAAVKRETASAELNALWQVRMIGGISGRQWQQAAIDKAAEIRQFYENAKAVAGDEFLFSAEDKLAFRQQLGFEEFFASDVELVLMAYYKVPIHTDPVTGRVDPDNRDQERLELLEAARREFGQPVYDKVLAALEKEQSEVERFFWTGKRTFMRLYDRPTAPSNLPTFLAWAGRSPLYGASGLPVLLKALGEEDEMLRQSAVPGREGQTPIGLLMLERSRTNFRAQLRAGSAEIDRWLRFFES